MNLDSLKLLYGASCLGLGLIVLSPTLIMVVRFPIEETFSELWILGPGHMAEDYPFNVREGEPYKVYLGVSNHMGLLEHYRVLLKFGNQTDPLPDNEAGIPSPLTVLYEWRLFLKDGGIWETAFTFSFSGVLILDNRSVVKNIVVNNIIFNVNKSAVWDAECEGYFYHASIELWTYNTGIQDFTFHSRSVGLRLNMTGSQ